MSASATGREENSGDIQTRQPLPQLLSLNIQLTARRLHCTVKLDASKISAKKRAEWAAVEAECAANVQPAFQVCLHNGKRLLWFLDGDIWVDGYVFADCYKMPVDTPQDQISERIVKLLGKVRITFDAELPTAQGG